jgi:hypothetical protein
MSPGGFSRIFEAASLSEDLIKHWIAEAIIREHIFVAVLLLLPLLRMLILIVVHVRIILLIIIIKPGGDRVETLSKD